MKKVIFVLLAACWGLQAGTGFALVKAQLYYARGSGDFKPDHGGSKTLSASGTGATLLLDPVPLVPVGFGLSFSDQTFSPDLADHGISELKGYLLAPEVQAWFPFLPMPLIPYGRLSWAIGAYKAKGQIMAAGQALPTDFILTSRGTRIGIGAKFEPIPFPLISLALLCELSRGFHSFKDRSSEIAAGLPAGLSADHFKSSLHRGSWSSNTVLFGIEAGF